MPERSWLILVESNTTGTGRLFAAAGRALGLRPVLLVADPNRYPYMHRDALDHVVTDTADEQALITAATELRARAPIGAVLSSSEYFIGPAAALAAALGVPAADARAILACMDKSVQRSALRGQVAQPGFAECRSAAEVAAAAERLAGPVVVKPCLGTGTEGVRACADPAEAAAWASHLLAIRVNERGMRVEPRVLVEEQIAGPEYSVEMLDGHALGVTAKHLGELPWFVETGHDFPAPLPRRDAGRLKRAACHAARILGLSRGPAHVELRLTAAGPVLIAANARLAGGMIPELVKLASGQDLITATIASAMGLPPGRMGGSRHHASIRFITLPGEGTVTAVEGLDHAREIPGVVTAACSLSPGDLHQRHHSFRDRVGYVLAVGETSRDAAEAAEKGRATVEIVLAQTTPSPDDQVDTVRSRP